MKQAGKYLRHVSKDIALPVTAAWVSEVDGGEGQQNSGSRVFSVTLMDVVKYESLSRSFIAANRSF
jgi:hypothetical protein